MDDDNLVKYLQKNGAAVNYGNLAANKKQLEGWLQYRGLDRGQIEQFLTYSVLSQ
jgi:hypothetical protein